MTRKALIAGALTLCAAGCGGEPRELTASEHALVQASNTFGFGFFREVVKRSDGANVFVSPLSVSMALGMTWNGAAGTTEAGMRRALEYGTLARDQVNESYRGLLDLLAGLDPDVTLQIANSIWYREGMKVLPAFLDVNRTYFDAEVQPLDFDDPAAVDTINGWVDDKTRGRIPTILPDEPIDPLTMMFLVDALYFEGDWTTAFDEDDTQNRPFTTGAGAQKIVEMMSLTHRLRYHANERWQAVELPYGAGHYAMTVLLPAGGTPLADFAASLDRAAWDELQSGLAESQLTLRMPRFRLETGGSLVDALAALGMAEAFSMQADFSGINGGRDLYLKDVLHKTFVRVDESGTEAAAATVVVVNTKSAGGDPTPVVEVNRPFLAVLHDRHSQTMMFMGAIVDPPSN